MTADGEAHLLAEEGGAVVAVRVFQVDPSPIFAPYDWEREEIRAAGGELIVADCATEDEVIAQAAGCEILLLSWRPLLTWRVLAALPECRLIVRWGVGYDMIDVAVATELGVAVANTPTYCIEDVAEHTIALLLAAGRRIAWYDTQIRQGGWQQMLPSVHRVTGRTLGIIGMGRIGAAVVRRARGLGLRVVACDPARSDAGLRAAGVEPRSMDELLAEADYVSLHVPLSAATYHLIGTAALRRMKPGAVLINTSRGAIVDEAALIEALRAGSLGGAALDVYEEEPLPDDSPLRSLEQVVLTPHAAAMTVQGMQGLRQEVCATVREWIHDGWSDHVINPTVRGVRRAGR